MRTYALFIYLIAILGSAVICANATYVTVINPYNYTVYSNSTINLGKVGPGQTVYLTISSNTVNSTGAQLPRGWNMFVVSKLPSGWVAQNSSLNNDLLSAKVSVGPNASDGIYAFNLTAVNIGNYSKIGSLTFTAYVNVTPDVFSLNATPTNLYTGPGQPTDIIVTINNTGVSDSPFVIGVEGLPAWNHTSTVIALHHTTGIFRYPVYENEPGIYHLHLLVNSSASNRISKAINLTLVVQASIGNDYSALGQGTILFPIVYAPVYAIMYFINALSKAF